MAKIDFGQNQLTRVVVARYRPSFATCKTTWRCHSAARIDDLAAFSGFAPREVVDQTLTFERFNPHIPETFLK